MTARQLVLPLSGQSTWESRPCTPEQHSKADPNGWGSGDLTLVIIKGELALTLLRCEVACGFEMPSTPRHLEQSGELTPGS